MDGGHLTLETLLAMQGLLPDDEQQKHIADFLKVDIILQKPNRSCCCTA